MRGLCPTGALFAGSAPISAAMGYSSARMGEVLLLLIASGPPAHGVPRPLTDGPPLERRNTHRQPTTQAAQRLNFAHSQDTRAEVFYGPHERRDTPQAPATTPGAWSRPA
jgi:hypothetical protein